MRTFLLLSTVALAFAACSQSAPAAPGDPSASKGAPAKLAGAPPLDASGVPRFRPGLYEVVQVDDGDEAETKRECLGEGADAELREILTKAPTPDCKVSRSTGPAGLQVASECRQNGMTNRLNLTVAGTDTAYEMTLAIGVTTPSGETSTTRSIARGRWLGACPAGMTAGQTEEDQ